MNNPQLSDAAANAEAAAVCTLLNSGFLNIYSGSQPANANTAVTSQVLLATLTFGSPAFGNPSGGVATANAITPDTSAAATGTATWFRCTKSDGTTVVFDGSVGTSGCDLNINTTAIQANAEVDCSSFTFTALES
jgi:hypothetical protein